MFAAIPSADPSLPRRRRDNRPPASGGRGGSWMLLRGCAASSPHRPALLSALGIGRGPRGVLGAPPPPTTVIEGRAREVRAGCAAQPRIPDGWNPARGQGRAGGCGQTLPGPPLVPSHPSRLHPHRTLRPPRGYQNTPPPPTPPDAERITAVWGRVQLRTTAPSWGCSGVPGGEGGTRIAAPTDGEDGEPGGALLQSNGFGVRSALFWGGWGWG